MENIHSYGYAVGRHILNDLSMGANSQIAIIKSIGGDY